MRDLNSTKVLVKNTNFLSIKRKRKKQQKKKNQGTITLTPEMEFAY